MQCNASCNPRSDRVTGKIYLWWCWMKKISKSSSFCMQCIEQIYSPYLISIAPTFARGTHHNASYEFQSEYIFLQPDLDSTRSPTIDNNVVIMLLSDHARYYLCTKIESPFYGWVIWIKSILKFFLFFVFDEKAYSYIVS